MKKNKNKLNLKKKKFDFSSILKSKLLYRSLWIILFVIITFYVFNQFNIVISYDSSKYYSYLDIFNGFSSFSNWDVERGFGFPLTLFIISKLFGTTMGGFKIGFYLFYLIEQILAAVIIYNCTKEYNLKNKYYFIIFIFIFFFTFNPLIVGWSHTMLTEAIVPTLYFLAVFLSLYWYKNDISKNKTFITVSILFSLLCVYLWFIKQPYVVAVWCIVFFSALLNWIRLPHLKQFIRNFSVVIIVIVVNLISILIWNKVLSNNNANVDTGHNNSYFLKEAVLYGLRYHVNMMDKGEYCNLEFINSMKISESRKQNIYNLITHTPNWCDYLYVFKVDDLQFENYFHDYFITKSEYYSSLESIKFVIKFNLKHPLISFNNYWNNYLSIIDINENKIGVYSTNGVFAGDNIKENSTAYFALSYNNHNTWWELSKDNPDNSYLFNNQTLKWIANMDKTFNTKTSNSDFFSQLFIMLKDGSMLSFKLLLLFCLPFFIYSLIKYIKTKKLIFYILSILSVSSFIHIIFHVVMGQIIDRYVYPVYPLMIIFSILILSLIIKDTEPKKIVD